MSFYQQYTAIKENNEQVIQQFYVDNFYRVKLFVMQNSGTIEEAKDVYQEAFLSVWRNIQLDKFSPRGEGALEAYILQIARNKWLDQLRSARGKTIQELQDDVAEYDDGNDVELDRIKVIKENFRKLGDGCKELLLRFYFKKESLKLIAETRGWTEMTAKNNKYRCMETLKKLVNPNRK